MEPAKNEALQAIQRLPENVEMDEIMYRLYVIEQIRKGREAVNEGKVIDADTLMAEIETW
jgi:hypothetical protein